MCLPDFQNRVPHIHVLLSNQSQILHEMEMTLRAASSETITVRGAAYVTAPEGKELPGLGTQRIVVGAFYDYLQGGSIMELLR